VVLLVTCVRRKTQGLIHFITTVQRICDDVPELFILWNCHEISIKGMQNDFHGELEVRNHQSLLV